MFGFFAGRWRPLLYCVFAFYESNLTYVTVPFCLQMVVYFNLTTLMNSYLLYQLIFCKCVQYPEWCHEIQMLLIKANRIF